MGEKRCLFKNQNHLVNLNNMRLSGQFCDVTIKVNDREFRAHRNILAANLNYFQSMFLNSSQDSQQDVFVMKNVEAEDLEAFISFAYTGEIKITDTNALGIFNAANHLNEDMIKQTCIEFLKTNLKEKDACRAYLFASAVECISLQNIAKSKILSNFVCCSRITEYFDFNCESLKQILTEVDLASESQQNLFEGVMRWILHDVKSRQIYAEDMLNLIDITKLSANYLMEYFCEDMKDQGDIVKETMLYYHQKMQERKCLVVLGVTDKKFQIQFYNIRDKNWCRVREIIDWNESNTEAWTISNNKFYYILDNERVCLKVFSLSDKRNTMLASESRLLRSSAMCACSRFLYLCGGCCQVDCPYSVQVLRYDSQTNTFEALPTLKTGRNNAAAIFYQGCLLVLGGYNGSVLNSVEKYDPDTKQWMSFASMSMPRSYFAAAVLDGKLYACGGYNKKAAEVYDPSKNRWQLIAYMNKVRDSFLVVAHEGKLLAIGGDKENTIEVYDPSEDQWHMEHEMSSGLQKSVIFGGGLISSSYANLHTA